MAEAPDATAGALGGKLGFLKDKVGPLPLGIWILIAVGIFVYLQRKNAAADNTATDPAGNVGVIDPATGYVYGSAEDKSALSSSIGGGGSTTDTTPSGSTVAGQYADNAAWGRAAVNLLVSLGVDATLANQSIQDYLSSQTLTTQEQANVNLAIQALGAPPTLPGPAEVTPPPVVTPPTGTVYANNPPTGLTVSGRTGNSISLKWNAVTNATGYMIYYGKTPSANTWSTSTGSTVTSTTVGSLAASTLWYFRVQAIPAKAGAPFASTSAQTTAASSSPSPGPSPSPTKRTYTVVKGDTLSSIARKLKIADWHSLYNTNRAVIEAAAKAHGHSSSNNGNLIYPGTKLVY